MVPTLEGSNKRCRCVGQRELTPLNNVVVVAAMCRCGLVLVFPLTRFILVKHKKRKKYTRKNFAYVWGK